MKHEDFSNYWYFNELPKLLDELKVLLNASNKEILAFEDYLNIFLEFFENFNAFKYFEKDLVVTDELSISVNFKFGLSEISFIRSFWLNPDFDKEFAYESYQINLNLYLNIKYTHESFGESFTLKRDKKNNFNFKNSSYWQSSNNNGEKINNSEYSEGIIDIAKFHQKIVSNKNISKYLLSTPTSISLYLNADV